MTPIRANIVGPPDVATRIKASIADFEAESQGGRLRYEKTYAL